MSSGRALADLCRRYTPSAPLLLTTRQDIEFHNLTTETIPLLQAELADAGLTSVGACGDTLRNITVCPGNGLCRGAPDLIRRCMGIARLFRKLRRHIFSAAQIQDKFISMRQSVRSAMD